jgi:hypothetical protein
MPKSNYMLTDIDGNGMLLALRQASKEFAQEIPAEYHKKFGKPLHVAIEFPEDEYLSVLYFLAAHTLSEMHHDPELLIRFGELAKEKYGAPLTQKLKQDSSVYRDIYLRGEKEKYDPINEVARLLFKRISNQDPDNAEVILVGAALVRGLNFKAAWQAVLKPAQGPHQINLQ